MARGITAKTDKKVLMAICNLEHSNDFAVICEWLKETKAKCEHNFLWGKEDRDLWQGNTQMITEILSEFDHDNALDNLKNAK